jgi:hypothetical protein
MTKAKIKPRNPALRKTAVRRCYYDDNLCEGEVISVRGFKKYLCKKCAKEDESITDEILDHDFSIGDR